MALLNERASGKRLNLNVFISVLVGLLFARGAMVARQVLTLKIEVRVLAGEPKLKN